MNHTQIINRLTFHHDYRTYLEIGVGNRANFDKISLPRNKKLGVDPNVKKTSIKRVSSDAFFSANNQPFDLIFIDGLHHCDQVYRDIKNALRCLNPRGTLVCHDMNPSSRAQQAVPQEQSEWTGDCWKAWVRVRAERTDLDMKVVDTDYGCGIIRFGTQPTIPLPEDLSWDKFVLNRKSWLNLITTEEFEALHSNFNIHSPEILVKPAIFYSSPYDSTLNIGKAYNAIMSLVSPETYVCLTDADTMFTIPNYGHIIERAIVDNPEIRLFSARTNRIYIIGIAVAIARILVT